MIEKNIKVLFGLKLHQIRKEKGLSLKNLSESTGLSISYLNEIEKGKKYPKQEKILILAKFLNVNYDKLVAVYSNKMLEPLTQIMESEIFNEIPFETFGISRETIFQIFAEAPTKVTAFFNVFLEIAEQSNLKNEDLFFSVLRAYQELHHNYFEEIEKKGTEFHRLFPFDATKSSKELKAILTNHYNYDIEQTDFAEYPALKGFRSILTSNSPRKKLYINKKLDKTQRAFIYAKELGFNYLELSPRPDTSSWVRAESFTMVLNNFLASYFAGTILIQKESLEKKLENLLSQEKWSYELFQSIMDSYFVSTETFFQRISNLLIQKSFIDKIFFIRYDVKSQKEYHITKELQLSKQINSYTQRQKEIKFIRWISKKNLQYYITKNKEHMRSSFLNITKSLQEESVLYCISYHRDKIFLEGGEYLSLGFEIKNDAMYQLGFKDDFLIHTITTPNDYEVEIMNEEERNEIQRKIEIEKDMERLRG